VERAAGCWLGREACPVFLGASVKNAQHRIFLAASEAELAATRAEESAVDSGNRSAPLKHRMTSLADRGHPS
jgi:hypothetical protein